MKTYWGALKEMGVDEKALLLKARANNKVTRSTCPPPHRLITCGDSLNHVR